MLVQRGPGYVIVVCNNSLLLLLLPFQQRNKLREIKSIRKHQVQISIKLFVTDTEIDKNQMTSWNNKWRPNSVPLLFFFFFLYFEWALSLKNKNLRANVFPSADDECKALRRDMDWSWKSIYAEKKKRPLVQDAGFNLITTFFFSLARGPMHAYKSVH